MDCPRQGVKKLLGGTCFYKGAIKKGAWAPLIDY